MAYEPHMNTIKIQALDWDLFWIYHQETKLVKLIVIQTPTDWNCFEKVQEEAKSNHWLQGALNSLTILLSLYENQITFGSLVL